MKQRERRYIRAKKAAHKALMAFLTVYFDGILPVYTTHKVKLPVNSDYLKL